MPQEKVLYASAAYDAASAGPSHALWGDCPVANIMADPSVGYIFWDDFLGVPAAWTATDDTGTGTGGNGAGGVFLFDGGGTTEYKGSQLQAVDTTAGPWYLAATKTLWFETRFKWVTAGGDMFAGISEVDTTILASSSAHALSTSYHLGFKCVTGDRVLLSTAKNNSTEATNPVNSATALTLATWYKLGFKVEPDLTTTFYLNGVEQPQSTTAITTTHRPDGQYLVVGLASRNYTTTRTYAYFDWVRLAQLR